MDMTVKDPKQFRNALGSFATGVTVVTTLDAEGKPVGMTANSFNSVSLDPMLVLWSIAKNANAYDSFVESNHFAIHILADDQQDLSQQFATKGIDRFAGLDYQRGHAEVPVLPHCSARFECDIEHRYDGGDHTILVGRVQHFEHNQKQPLVFHAGRYAQLEQAETIDS